MREVPHWREPRSVRIARSSSGVAVTTHPLDNLVRGLADPWPSPEVLQKFTANGRFCGATPEDDTAARSGLGYYCDLQSLNSEDAITWSVFGSFDQLAEKERSAAIARLFDRFGLPLPDDRVTSWLWRRLPHPEKPESNGGPEIDFGFLSRIALVLGEAKWNSPLGKGQGINKIRSQLFLRLACCDGIAKRAFPPVTKFVVAGIARTADLLREEQPLSDGVKICNLTWADAISCFDGGLKEELQQYLNWRSEFARTASYEASSVKSPRKN